jgi:PAS domain S-box-containing protein
MNMSSPTQPPSDLHRLEVALEAGNVAWWEMDCRTGAVWFHRRGTDMLGYEPDLFRHYTDFTALLHPDDLERVIDAMRDHLQGARPDYRVDYRIRNHAGGYLWFQDVGRVSQRDDEGQPAIVTGIVLDVTERKRVEAALREGEERFRTLFHGHSAIKLVLDPQSGSIVDANEAAARFYGWSIPDLKRMRIQQINALSSEKVESAMAWAASAQNARFEFRHLRADGSARDVEVFSNRVEIAGRAYLYSIIHDIGDRKRVEAEQREAEAALRKSERSLVHAEEFARFGHWEFTLDDEIMHASAGAAKIYGFAHHHVPLRDVQRCVLAEDRPRLDSALRDLVGTNAPYDVEFRIHRVSDGATVAVHSRAEFDAAGRNVFGVVQDITERKRIETERETLILQLQSAIEHIKTLKGIVPICASCKKVRDDEGFWEQVEAYLSRHTDVRFSHGICPDCLKKHYPGF